MFLLQIEAWLETLETQTQEEKEEEEIFDWDAETTLSLGLTCAMVDKLSSEEALDLMATITNQNADRGMHYSVLKCFRKKIEEKLR